MKLKLSNDSNIPVDGTKIKFAARRQQEREQE